MKGSHHYLCGDLGRFLHVDDERRTVCYYTSRSDFDGFAASGDGSPTHVLPLDQLVAVRAVSSGGAGVFAFEMHFEKEEDAEAATGYQSVPSRRDSTGGRRSSSARNIWSGCGVVWRLGTDTERERSRWVEGLQRRIEGASDLARSDSAQEESGEGTQEGDDAEQDAEARHGAGHDDEPGTDATETTTDEASSEMGCGAQPQDGGCGALRDEGRRYSRRSERKSESRRQRRIMKVQPQ